MITLTRGTAAEFEEIIDFIDFVFSKNSAPHDFPKMYPNLYRPTDECMNALVNLREDGVIKSSVLVLPRTLSVNGTELKVYGIGNVATHPRARGRGFMSRIMNETTAELKATGAALGMLGGRRSRYNRFGYEVGGNAYQMDFAGSDVTEAWPDFKADVYTFRTVEADETELIDRLHAIYNAKPVHYCYDRDNYVLRFYNWNGNRPYAVYDASGAPIGCLALSGISGDRARVCELVTADDAVFEDVLFAFAVQQNLRLNVKLAPWQFRFVQRMLRIGAALSGGADAMWNVFDWPLVLKTLLSFKAGYVDLENGTMVIDIGESGRWGVTVTDGKAAVEPAACPADLELSALDAIYTLTGLTPSALVSRRLPQRVQRLFASWFPLPLAHFDTERV